MFATNKTYKTMRFSQLASRVAGVSLTLVLVIGLSPLALAQSRSNQVSPDEPIEEQMSPAERRATGLNKLSADELRALNAWLSNRDIETASRPSTEPKDNRGFTERVAEVFRSDDNTDDVITSRLVGTFDGWEGETIFELENGMVWRQVETNLYTVRPVNNPEVVIRRGLFDRWRLQVKGYNKRLTVERVK